MTPSSLISVREYTKIKIGSSEELPIFLCTLGMSIESLFCGSVEWGLSSIVLDVAKSLSGSALYSAETYREACKDKDEDDRREDDVVDAA